jgi:phospholipid/cholesterol/gamma-HCH transport system ATP-binding protein
MADTATDEVLRFDDVSLHFDRTPALDHVSFAMKAGETRVVFGAAGSGKTVMLKTAVGLEKPDSGRIILFGEDVTNFKESAMYPIRSKVGILFQEGGLFDSMNIADNVAYPLLNQQARRNGHGPLSQADIDEKVLQTLNFVELGSTLQK